MGSAHLEVVHRIALPRCSRIVCRPSKLALQFIRRALANTNVLRARPGRSLTCRRSARFPAASSEQQPSRVLPVEVALHAQDETDTHQSWIPAARSRLHAGCCPYPMVMLRDL